MGSGDRDTNYAWKWGIPCMDELDSKTNPLEVRPAGLSRKNKGDLWDGMLLKRVRKEGVSDDLQDRLLERGVPRTAFSVKKDDQVIGVVTTASVPTAWDRYRHVFRAPELARPGINSHIIRGKKVLGESVRPPFVEAKVRKAK